MTALEEIQIAVAEQQWAHEVEDEMEEEEKLEEGFEECLHPQPAR
ncbi:MAG: hypothetical protein P4M01_14610 [Acidobacteriota bacterium]|nr:hypothetical protein [Acidobacteriota bacterium]